MILLKRVDDALGGRHLDHDASGLKLEPERHLSLQHFRINRNTTPVGRARISLSCCTVTSFSCRVLCAQKVAYRDFQLVAYLVLHSFVSPARTPVSRVAPDIGIPCWLCLRGVGGPIWVLFL
jgi:hypothetical protein